MVRIGGFSSPRVAKVGKRCPPLKRKTKGIAPAVDTGKSEGSPSRSSPSHELPSMGLFSGASIFDTLVDDFDLQWDLACHDLHDSEFRSIGCLDDEFDSNGDLASRAREASKSKSSPMCCEAPLHSQSLSMNENTHIGMATSESSVKDPLSSVEWTVDIEADDNSSSHPLPVVGSTPPKGVMEMVSAPSCFHTSPSPPPLSKSCVGYSADYKPISRYASSWKDQRLPSQQTVVDNTTHGNDSPSKKPTRGGRHRRNRTQASQGCSDGDNKQGSTSKEFSKKYAVILGRDFLLINRTLQSSLKTAKAFRFFHRASISPVELREKIDSPTDPMNCDSEDFVSNTSPMVEVGKVAICDPFPMSTSLQSVLHPSNLVEAPTRIEAFKPYAPHKRKRVHTIEDSCNEPHVFRAPQRHALR